jgi:very-short-patch-repair endonuclease
VRGNNIIFSPDEKRKFILGQARRMRKDATDAEQLLWHIIRSNALGVKFRRQHPAEGYILDFYSHEVRLAIELDGGQHNETDLAEKDSDRTNALCASGIEVLRFWNNDILQNTDDVIEHIYNIIQEKKNKRVAGER